MIRTIIGGLFMLGGLLLTTSIIISGSIYATSMTAWSGKSKLWYAIFGAEQYGGEAVQSLFLGIPFITGILLSVIGLAIVGYEYYMTFKNHE